MAIELTTASDNIIDSIRESLSAIGSDTIKEIVDITRANYNLLTKDLNTLYVVNEGVGVNRSFFLGTSRIDFSGSIVGNLSASGTVYAAGGNSSTWNSTTNIININSAKWNSNSTTVSVNSASWIGTTTIVAANSANWILAGGNTTGANLNIGTNDNYNLNLETANTPRLTVASNGNVGINNTTPQSKLEIFDTSLANSGSLSGSGLYLAQAWNTTGSPVALKLNITNNNSGPASKLMDLRVSEASKFNVSSLGNVGIGNSQPVSKVDIYDNTTAIDLSGAALNIFHVWNAPLKDVTAIKLNVSSSGSGANSKFLDLQLGGSSYFSVNKVGNVSTVGNASIAGNLSARTFIGLDTTITGTQLNWAAGSSFSRTLTSNTTFTFTNAQPGQEIVVAVSSPLSSYTITWPTVTWPGAVTPTQSTADQTDVYTFKNIGNIIYGAVNRSSRVFEDAGVIYVKTWAQLQAALTVCGANNGGTIFIDGTIVIPANTFGGGTGTGGLNITVPNVTITGHSNGKSVLKLQVGTTYTTQIIYTVNINANNVIIENITIEGAIIIHTFNSVTRTTPSIGIHLARGANNLGMSDTVIRNTHIFNTLKAIWLSGGTGSNINRNLAITGNKIRSSGAGVYLEQSLDGCIISENSIVGDGALYDGTKYSSENCIWVGYGMNRCRIVNNHCADHQRMGIEVFWPYRNTYNTAEQNPSLASRDTSTAGVVVANNTISNVGSMGISFAGARGSIVSNNTISDVVFVGLEIVGDDRSSNSQVPDRIVNATVIGNNIKNVRATPRRLRNTAPVNPWNYGYSNMELEPSSCSLNAQRFRNRILSNNTASYTIGLKTITITDKDYFNEFGIGKEVKLYRTDDATNYMLGVVSNIETYEGDPDTYLSITVTSLAPDTVASSSLFSFRLCPHGLHTISMPSLQLIWTGNNSQIISLPNSTTPKGTALFLRFPGYDNNTDRDKWIQCYVVSYVPGATTASIFIVGTSSLPFDNTSWIAFPSQMVVGLSIDQINGCRVVNNTVDTVLDSSSSLRFGCQMFDSTNIEFENNTLIRAGLRYVFLNNCNNVLIANNKFRSGDVLMERNNTTLNITKLGEDLFFPEDILRNDYAARPCSLYAVFTATSPGYNSSLPYNNCKYIFRDNTITPSINSLNILTNSAPIFSHPNARPETLFGTSVRFRSTSHTGGFPDPITYNSPVIDYSQKWNNSNPVTDRNSQSFTSYRFNTDVGLSDVYSRVFDISVGDEIFAHARTWTSSTTNTLSAAFQPKTWTISGTTIIPVSSVPVGTFVRCTGSRLDQTNPVEGFVEGRVTSRTAGSNTFTMSASNAQTFGSGTLTSSLTSWKIQFDTTALFVDKLAQLNLRSNIVLDYHTGTKFGTSSAQKLGFWDKTPTTQPAAVAKATDATSAIAQLNTLIDRLSSIGILAS